MKPRISLEAAEELVRASLGPGSVFLFAHDGFDSPKPHFFFVLNHDPLADSELIMVWATSDTDRARRLCQQSGSVLIELAHEDYSHFNKPSAINCGSVKTATIGTLARKCKDGDLEFKSPVDATILASLRQGVIDSKPVLRRHQNMLVIKS